jgi:DNA-binding NarL/FixJ family response regulator
MDLHRLRVFIVDDHDIVRIGLCTAISKLHCVVGLAGTVADALEQLPRTRPNVALVDFRLPDGTGVELCRQIRAAHPEIAVVLLSAYLSEDTVRSALAAGAAAYVTKASGLPELMGVLDALGQGAESAAVGGTQQIVSRMHAAASRAQGARLTPHQENILELAARGLTNQEIGSRLYISESTVRFHMQNMKKALGARSKTDLIVRAMRIGAISPAPEGAIGA